MTELRALLADLGLELAEDKTRLVCVNEDGEGFDFWAITTGWSTASATGFRFMARWPSARATAAAKQRIVS